MENQLVKNLQLLNLSPEQAQTLHERAERLLHDSGIVFKIISCQADTLTLRIAQQKVPDEQLLDSKRLIAIARETFGDLGSWRHIHAGPIPYREPDPTVVTPAWIQTQLRLHSLKPKAVSIETGIDAKMISDWKSGRKPLSGVVRAFWYYYFFSKGR